MFKNIKQFFCKHYYTISRWHYTHGVNGNEPRIIEAEVECIKCGKISYIDIPRDKTTEFEKYFFEKKV